MPERRFVHARYLDPYRFGGNGFQGITRYVALRALGVCVGVQADGSELSLTGYDPDNYVTHGVWTEVTHLLLWNRSQIGTINLLKAEGCRRVYAIRRESWDGVPPYRLSDFGASDGTDRGYPQFGPENYPCLKEAINRANVLEAADRFAQSAEALPPALPEGFVGFEVPGFAQSAITESTVTYYDATDTFEYDDIEF